MRGGRQLYTIREAAVAIGRSAATLRRWERQGLIKPARRDLRTGTRLYSHDDIRELVRFVGRDASPTHTAVDTSSDV